MKDYHPFYCDACDSSAWVNADTRAEAKKILTSDLDQDLKDRWEERPSDTQGMVLLCPLCARI